MSDPITLAQSRAPPSPATATPPLPIAVAKENGSSSNAAASVLARSSGSLQVRGRSPTPSRGECNGPDSEYGSVCGSLRGSSVRGSSPAVNGNGTGSGDDKPRGTSPPPPVAPYQALPVRGPVNLITHNMTEGLPVVEPGETDPKVSFVEVFDSRERSKRETSQSANSDGERRLRPQPCKKKKPFSQELDARMTKVISDYTAQLTERTEHHMG